MARARQTVFIVLIAFGCAEQTVNVEINPLDAATTDAFLMDLPQRMDVQPEVERDLAINDQDAGSMERSPSTMLSADCSAWQRVDDNALRARLHTLLQETYTPIQPMPNFGGQPDRYTTARRLMFTRVARYEGADGDFIVDCLYTDDTASAPFDSDPDDELINCEHVWPRARLASDRMSSLYEHQQSDIHHLMPTRPSANSLRGSLPFGNVVRDVNRNAEPSLRGLNERGDEVFEPADAVKGDVSRMIFYMSVRWGLNLSSAEESALRAWHVMDPADEMESLKNDAVEALQGNRNPFIDCPELVNRIDDFEAFQIDDEPSELPLP